MVLLDFHIENFNDMTIKIYVFEVADYEFQGFEGVACEDRERSVFFVWNFLFSTPTSLLLEIWIFNLEFRNQRPLKHIF